jgi:AcrR family transcriptional regulator
VTRRTAQDRRRQLIGIGLGKLITTPIHQLTVDAVAAEAGISRSLLFHYFPTKQDYYLEVVRAAGRRLLRATATEAEDQVRGMVTGYVGYVRRRRAPYLALFRGSTSEDWVRTVHTETLDALSDRMCGALGVSRGGTQELTVRAWWAFAEELTIDWTGREADPEDLVDLLVGALHSVVGLAGQTASTG